MLDRARTQRRRLNGAPFALVGGVDDAGMLPINRAELRKARTFLSLSPSGKMASHRLTERWLWRRRPVRFARLFKCSYSEALN